jgi:two-component system phosphate regulon response regulator PhoB
MTVRAGVLNEERAMKPEGEATRGEMPSLAICAVSAVPTILAVDDDPDALTLLTLFLSKQGFRVLSASGGEEALERIREQLPDLVITDLTMPRMDGLELCARLRNRAETRHIPIIVHTGRPPDMQQPLICDRIFTKPADLAGLLSAIRELLKGPGPPA